MQGSLPPGKAISSWWIARCEGVSQTFHSAEITKKELLEQTNQKPHTHSGAEPVYLMLVSIPTLPRSLQAWKVPSAEEEERKHEKEVEGTLFWSERATERGGRETGTLSQLQWSPARNSQRLSAMPYPCIEEEGHKWKWKIKGKNRKKDGDYYLNFQFSLVFLAISWQNSQKQFTCILIFKIVISTAAKLGCALNSLVRFFPTFIKYQLQGQPFHLHGQHLRGETPEVNGSEFWRHWSNEGSHQLPKVEIIVSPNASSLYRQPCNSEMSTGNK